MSPGFPVLSVFLPTEYHLGHGETRCDFGRRPWNSVLRIWQVNKNVTFKSAVNLSFYKEHREVTARDEAQKELNRHQTLFKILSIFLFQSNVPFVRAVRTVLLSDEVLAREDSTLVSELGSLQQE